MTFWGSDSRPNPEQERAASAFKSPSQLATRLTGTRSPIQSGKSGESVLSSPSRRAPSIVTDAEDQRTYQELIASTGVVVKTGRSPRSRHEVEGDHFGGASHPIPVDHLLPPALDHHESQQRQQQPTKQSVTSALSRADAAISGANNTMRSTVAESTRYSGGSTRAESTIKTNKDDMSSTLASSKISAPSIAASSAMTPRSISALDLRKNDTQFHIIASVVVGKFQHNLTSGATSITLTARDKQQLDRMVPQAQRQNFVEAVRMRLQSSPEHSRMPIHVVCQSCHALGLDRDMALNLLYVQPGTAVPIIRNKPLPKEEHAFQVTEDSLNSNANPESLARQQLLAELREASNLMAESVTPEAAQFWRKHVVELQARLRALHSGNGVRAAGDGGEDILRTNERLLASLQMNTGYVPPSQDEMFQPQQQQESREMTITPHTPTQTTMDHHTPTQMSNTPHTPTQMPITPHTPTQEANLNSNTQSGDPLVFFLDPNLQGLPMVDVVSPADLPGGYCFEAEIEDRRFLAMVPPDGVRKGETFSCYMRDLDIVGSEIPVGRWRDSMFDCFKHGVFHPLVLNAVFCPLIALAQIMARLGFDFMGRPGQNVPRKGFWSTWGMMLTIIVFWVFLNTVVLLGFNYKWATHVALSAADAAALLVVNISMLAYVMYATAATRGSLREKYLIREHRFIDLEDCLCGTFCMPCTICQMGRHTASFGDHEGVCCNATGIPDSAPETV